jgi:prepilin-type N-terminal cleavage/methylation domain-containing protein
MNRKGFTLIELLIIIAIIGFLAAAVLVAVDPVRRIQDARNARRSAETNAILNAILKKQVDDRALFDGDVAAPIITQAGSNVQVIVRDSAGIGCGAAATRPGCDFPTSSTGTECVADLSDVVPEYLSELPLDPRLTGVFCGTGSTCTTIGVLALGDQNTGYYIARTDQNRIEIGSCLAEGDPAPTINVKR